MSRITVCELWSSECCDVVVVGADWTRPDAGGSCIDVPTAVAGWKKYMQPLSGLNPEMYLGSPGVTNAGADDTHGLGWLEKFLETCDGCTVDFLNLHW